VLVGFELGDPERPVVIGGLWNRQAKPPAVAVERGEVTGRHWTSRDGHTLFLDDGGSGRAVLAHGGGDVTLELERDRAGIDGGRNLDLQADEITLEAGTRLVLRAPSIEIDGSADVTVTGGMIRLN
jgi:uncharacterized protein involved in type VI secretion and phage assembly